MQNVIINDNSLRLLKTGILSFKEKLEIAKSLAELKVDVIELSALLGDKGDDVLIKTICSIVKKSLISCYAGNTISDVEKAYSCIESAKNKRLLVCVPVSPVQMEYYASKKPNAVLEQLKSLTSKAVSLCNDVEVSLEDATRAEPKFLYQAISTAIECGAKTICLTDLAGTMLENEFSDFVKGVYDNVPNLKNVKLMISVSDEFSLAISCILSALKLGVNGVKISTLNLGNLPNANKLFSAIEYLGGKLGYSLAINKTVAQHITQRIAEISCEKCVDNTINDLREKSEDLCANITQKQLIEQVNKLGYQLNSEDYEKIYQEYLRVSAKKTVNTFELDVIVATLSLQVPETYSLVSYSVNSSNILTATASIILNKNNETVSGLSYGNGAVDAAFLALENICGRHFELDDFKLGSVTEGKGALGQAVVRLRANGKIYSGRGLSTDIVGASIRAYINALNKIVYEENN